MSSTISAAGFIRKWSAAELPERAASQEHFCDLCRLLGQPTPAEHDAHGSEYTFEKGVTVTDAASRGSKGQYGFADVWWRGKFAWEYKRKGKHKELSEAYRQLCQYREALENPPLLIVSDIARIQIHTNFTGTRKEVHEIPLANIAHPDHLDKLRRVFTDPLSFKPTLSTYRLTEEAAAEFAKVADQMRQRGHDPHDSAHFLMKCMFCLFAEDVGLLPRDLFSMLLTDARTEPERLPDRLNALFAAMRDGGHFGVESIAHFNGGLFDDAEALPLKTADIHAMLLAGQFDWGAVEPTIFGTLFERSLDPDKRSQIGAHYTSREDIMLIVEPVVMAPLRREWADVQEKVEKQLLRRRKAGTKETRRKADAAIAKAIDTFLDHLATLRVLDPACGSGNFLYVAIQELLALEKEVIVFAARPEIGLGLFPRVRPTQLHGIEINPYAAELAQVVIWIGYLQWMRDNGFIEGIASPILEPLQTIECRDAILDFSIPTKPQPATWPRADLIIGNPPFLGSKLFRQYGLSDDYLDALYGAYELPNTSDLCCYWFEMARKAIERHKNTRAGLLATQGIRGGANRTVLERIKKTGDIFMAWSDRQWILDGAAVHVSIVGFAAECNRTRSLDGAVVETIAPDLSGVVGATRVASLPSNSQHSYMGVTPSGRFQVGLLDARAFLVQPNPSGKPNSDVLRLWYNARDLTQRHCGLWIIDFGCDVQIKEAAQYEAPFEYVRAVVAPKREKYRTGKRAFWCFERPRPEMRVALAPLTRYVATPLVSKHRVFSWMQREALPANLVIVFAREDDYFFGVLHSAVHELWALRMGTQLEDRPRYTPTTCFETFPLPWAPGTEPVELASHERISTAARALNEQRERWLNPPEWIELIARDVDSKDNFDDVPEKARALIRHSAIMAEAARDPRLKKRTLTNLYNERPTWLRLAHEQLDRAVLAAYAAVDPAGDWAEDWSAVWVDTGAGQPLPEDHELADRRKEVDQQVLANLLRLNQERSE